METTKGERELRSRPARGLRLSSGRRCALSKPSLPGLRRYYVLALCEAGYTSVDLREQSALAHRIGQMMARRHFGDPECYTLLYNAARTRRKPWPHVHILVARSVAEKRRDLLLFQLKHLLRWRRWPVFRFVGLSEVA